MQIYLSLMSQKNPSSDSSSYDLSSPQGRMLYVRETTNAAFSSWTSPLQRQDPDTQEEKKQEMLSRIMGKLKSGKKLSAKELDFLRRTDPILYAHALRVQRMAEALKQQLSHAKSKQEANDMITSAIAGVSDKDPDKEYLLAAYNEVSKNFHKSPAYQRLPNTPEDAKKRKTNNPNAHFSDDEDIRKHLASTPKKIGEWLDTITEPFVLDRVYDVAMSMDNLTAPKLKVLKAKMPERDFIGE